MAILNEFIDQENLDGNMYCRVLGSPKAFPLGSGKIEVLASVEVLDALSPVTVKGTQIEYESRPIYMLPNRKIVSSDYAELDLKQEVVTILVDGCGEVVTGDDFTKSVGEITELSMLTIKDNKGVVIAEGVDPYKVTALGLTTCSFVMSTTNDESLIKTEIYNHLKGLSVFSDSSDI